ncbi:hypothetical protein BDV33DRAFT_206730 [Aspergillus novoparasiticus]|uniref:Translationally-controlled tumor protein homolog n=1 Tax=Aspergillus novoparasiticus TaxID=986946 RepID=A0A5N6EI39_9EURO|nr:hypothetical protein BDV33DRAFT_206730 [Aspergillus novoparasiticus]
MFVDLSPITEVDDFVYEVECPKEVDILETFNLEPVNLDKTAYYHYTRSILPERSPPILKQKLSLTLVEYIKNLTYHLLSKSDNQEEVRTFANNFDAYVKDKVLPHFDDFDSVQFHGESDMVLLVGKRDDGTLYLKYWKHGLEREEVEENERDEWDFKYGKYGSHHEEDEEDEN